MSEIPDRLKNFSFVLCNEQKQPIQTGWQKKFIKFDNSELKEHLEQGKNYGVSCGNLSPIIKGGQTYFLIVIDFDKKEIQDKVFDKFPETFTTTSNSPKNCYHLWFASDNDKSFKILDEKRDTLADVQGTGKQIIAPGSKHQSGSTYSIVKDIDFAFIPYSEIEAILKPLDKSLKKEIKLKKQYSPKGIGGDITKQIYDSVSMFDVLTEIGIDTSKNPTNCFLHDSKGGKCFLVNDETCKCFHCDNSWNKFSLIREAKNLTDKQTFEWFAEKSGMTEELKKSRQEFAEKNPEKSKTNFILDQNQIPQQIDHAVGKIKINEKYFRYNGFFVSEEIEKTRKFGETIRQIKRVPAIVLETGDIYSENTKPERVNFQFGTLMTLKNNRWSLKSIKSFVNENFNSGNYSFTEVYNCFKKFYEDSMVFEESEVYSFRALRDIKSYFWDINDKFMILKTEGISGSAKSKAMKIGANLSFNGKKFLCPTPANFFRYRHHNKATLFIEEAEKLFDVSKKKNVGDSELIEYLNGSYEKGNTVPRQNDKNINQTDEFDPSGETEIGSINPLKGALEKRSIPLQMIKAPKKDIRGNVEIPSETDEEYCKARDMMYICSLLNYKEFEKALAKVKNIFGLQNREWILAKPYIALASCISPKLEKQIGDFIKRKFTIRDDSFDSESWERIMAEVLIKIFCEKEENQFISTNHIKGRFLLKLGNDYNKISSHKISKLINTLGLSDYKTRSSTGDERGYEISFFKLSEILIRNEWINIKELIKKVSEVPNCQFIDDKINKWFSDTFLTLDTSDKKKEISDTLTDLTLYSGVDNDKIDFSQSKIKEDLEDG